MSISTVTERKAHNDKDILKLEKVYLMNNPQCLTFELRSLCLQISFDCPGSIKIVPIGKLDVRNMLGKLLNDSLSYGHLHSM